MSDIQKTIARLFCAESCLEACADCPFWKAEMPHADSFIAALTAAGYSVVPTEPTEGMVAAGEEACGMQPADEVWRAMLAAAAQEGT